MRRGTCTSRAARSPSSSRTTGSRAGACRCLSNAYRALRRTVPEQRLKTEELDEIIDWLGETVRQTELRACSTSGSAQRPGLTRARDGRGRRGTGAAAAADHRERARLRGDGAQRDVPQGWKLASRDRYDELATLKPPPRPRSPARQGHDEGGVLAGARSRPTGRSTVDGHRTREQIPQLLMIDRRPADGSRTWAVRQIVDDPEGHHDFAIVATSTTPRASHPSVRSHSRRPASRPDALARCCSTARSTLP